MIILRFFFQSKIMEMEFHLKIKRICLNPFLSLKTPNLKLKTQVATVLVLVYALK